MGVKFGGSTFSFMWKEPALASIRRLGSLGLRDFDVIAAPGHLWPEELDGHARTALRRELANEHLSVESVNLPALDFNLGSCIREVRAYSVEKYDQALRLSADLEGRGVVVVPGRVSGLLPPAHNETLSWLGDSVETLLRVADELGQVLLLETHPQTALASAAAMVAFVEPYGHPRLRVAYDVANAEFIGEDQVVALKCLAPILGQVHLSDATRTSWRHDRAGLGTVPFNTVMLCLEEIRFDGVAIVEVISHDARADTAATIQSLNG
jgi:L-ribulose-5-phosphate 3-epimerase